ncbi:hypothetical protein EIP91_002522 [Steccherinum ochraceum]|uniref:Uncharacterized protein n=1 Tax=Steccherinum ochraceum TaxID=92696 RepID=A0A4R0RNV5_9APHY|nr:hypothetical protein EIP91_002522 [Steccherinum ochraceum]
MASLFLFLVAFFALLLSALAQTLTTTDALGNTIIENVTLNPAGIPTTQTLSTVTAALAAPAAATTATTTTPEGQQGPVGQPPVTSGPAPPTVYQYTTTDANGNTVAIQDTFTPTFGPTQPPSAPASGTILSFSQWLSQIGTNTPQALNDASPRWHLSSGWLAITSGLVSCFLGGVYLVLV